MILLDSLARNIIVMTNQKTLNVILLFAFLITLFVNYLSNALPINGFTAGQLSDLYPNQFTPSGKTFAIWGLIYTMCVLAIIQLFREVEQFSSKVRILFITSCVLNVSWLLAWHYQIVALSVVIMIAFLTSLILLYIEVRNQEKVDWSLESTSSIYLGWISVALIANSTTFLLGFDFFANLGESTESLIASIMIIIALGLSGFFVYQYRDWMYAGVVCWASYGIYEKRLSVKDVNDSLITNVSFGVFFLCIILIFITIFLRFKRI